MDGHEEWGEVVWRDEARPARPPFDLEFKKENLWFSRFDAANLTVKISPDAPVSSRAFARSKARAQLEAALAAHQARERRRDVLCLVFWAIVLPFGALVWILGGMIVSAFLAAP